MECPLSCNKQDWMIDADGGLSKQTPRFLHFGAIFLDRDPRCIDVYGLCQAQ